MTVSKQSILICLNTCLSGFCVEKCNAKVYSDTDKCYCLCGNNFRRAFSCFAMTLYLAKAFVAE